MMNKYSNVIPLFRWLSFSNNYLSYVNSTYENSLETYKKLVKENIKSNPPMSDWYLTQVNYIEEYIRVIKIIMDSRHKE